MAEGHRTHKTPLKKFGHVNSITINITSDKLVNLSFEMDNLSYGKRIIRPHAKTNVIIMLIAYAHLVPYLYYLADSVITHICSDFIID